MSESDEIAHLNGKLFQSSRPFSICLSGRLFAQTMRYILLDLTINSMFIFFLLWSHSNYSFRNLLNLSFFGPVRIFFSQFSNISTSTRSVSYSPVHTIHENDSNALPFTYGRCVHMRSLWLPWPLTCYRFRKPPPRFQNSPLRRAFSKTFGDRIKKTFVLKNIQIGIDRALICIAFFTVFLFWFTLRYNSF